MIDTKIIDMKLQELKFPTSQLDEGDTKYTDANYSCIYVTIGTNTKYKGYGITYTLEKETDFEGIDIMMLSCKAVFEHVKNRPIVEIYSNFASFWRKLTNAFKVVGSERGVIHTAKAVIVNALWDLWARIEEKPAWKLLVNMSPEYLVSTVDFTYITDVITKENAIRLLSFDEKNKWLREIQMKCTGFPSYITEIGSNYGREWDYHLTKAIQTYGFDAFKVKVDRNVDKVFNKCKSIIHCDIMLDMKRLRESKNVLTPMIKLKELNPFWIEEIAYPDDVCGHDFIVQDMKMNNINIPIAYGNMCPNRVYLKQFADKRIMPYWQINPMRLGGVNEALAVYLMAKMCNVMICPPGDGVGLGEMTQHLQLWDFISLSQTMKDYKIEFVDEQHEYFEDPVCIKNGHYIMPTLPGFSTKLKDECILEYAYPEGEYWKRKYIKDSHMRFIQETNM